MKIRKSIIALVLAVFATPVFAKDGINGLDSLLTEPPYTVRQKTVKLPKLVSISTTLGIVRNGKLDTLTGDYEEAIRKLEKKGYFRTLARPTIYAIDKKKATIQPAPAMPSGRKADGIFANNTFQFDFIPQVQTNGEVKLDITMLMHQIEGYETYNNYRPHITSTELTTTPVIQDGGTVFFTLPNKDVKTKAKYGTLALLVRTDVMKGN